MQSQEVTQFEKGYKPELEFDLAYKEYLLTLLTLV